VVTRNITCAWCGSDSDAWDFEDHVPGCSSCLSEVPEPDAPDESIGARIRHALRWNPGATVKEVCELIGVIGGTTDADEGTESRRVYDVVIHHIGRLVKRGYATAEGKPGGRRRYYIKSEKECAAIDEARRLRNHEIWSNNGKRTRRQRKEAA
jgi:hypothetical protein